MMGGSKMLKNTSGSKVTCREDGATPQIKRPFPVPVRLFSHLPQHLIVLDLVTFGPADFSLQRVLVEAPADVHQDGGGAGVDGTAQDHVAHARGYVHPEP